MSERVEALFAGEPPPPPADIYLRLRRLNWVLAVAVPLDLLGILCWTGVPGAILTLWVWLSVDGEMAAIEAGTYDGEDVARIMRIRRIAFWALAFSVVSLIIQAWLLGTPFYERLWARMFPAFGM